MLSATEYARRAVSVWVSLPPEDPIVAEIAKAFEQASGPLAQCLYTGFGSVEIKVRDKRVNYVGWHQGMFYTSAT